jgi:hypothetical protein
LIDWKFIREPLRTSTLKQGAVVAVGEMPPQREREKKELQEGRQDRLQMLQAQPSKEKKDDILLGCLE